jgi:nucleoside-diphosphate-sugar epimerase
VSVNNPEKTVLVLGANGRFGQAAVAAFASAGWRVLAQARHKPGNPLPSDVVHLSTSLLATNDLASASMGAKVVVFAVNPPYTKWRHEALPLARLGMDVAQRLDAAFMFPGNVYNFGAGMPPLLDESTAERPTSSKGRIRCEIEGELSARAGSGLRSVVIRAGDFFGVGSGAWLDLVVTKSFAKGKLVYPGELDVAHAWAYLPDFARAFVAVAQGEMRGFERFHFAGHTLTGAQLLEAIDAAAQALGARPAAGFKIGTMPWGLLRLGSAFVPMWKEIAEMSYLWHVPHALDGSRLTRRIGEFQPTPLHVAMRQTLIDLGLASSGQRQLSATLSPR